MSLAKYSSKVAAIVADAGGRVVGRTRLQKIAYLLTVTGQESGFTFSYKHYGPYSENLANLARMGSLLKQLNEVEHSTSWGGNYSVYTVDVGSAEDTSRTRFARIAADADAIDLELAATAVFLFREGYQDPWEETARRKPEKSENGHIERAKALIRHLQSVETPVPLPSIA